MKLIHIVSTSAFQIVSILFLLGYLLGVLNIYFSDKNNYCEMTYMFEYPQFVPISLEENQKYPQYGLYAYSEGRFTEKARKMMFDGIPVLFLPGNSGSYMQARSLASVALRKALTKGYEYHFDFFTISFSEEYSGLYGGVLQSQTEFAAASISKILSLYKNQKYTKSVPTSVIVIGHSMGGLVAKRLMAYQSTLNTTNVVIALAAPLDAPVINFDNKINEYYMLMDTEWRHSINSRRSVKNKKVLISISSGPRDVMVPAGLTSSKDSYVNTLATAIPGVWVSPDHVSMVWCKQLVMVINRYLFDIVDPKTNQITKKSSHLKSKAKQYFQANRSMTLNKNIQRAQVPMQADAFWYEDSRRVYQIARPSIDKMVYVMIRLVSFPESRFVAIQAVNVDDEDWVFGCNAMYTHFSYRYCKDATSIGELSRWTGAAKDFGRRKLATINLHSLIEKHPDWTHVIVGLSPTKKPVTLNVDINDYASRRIRVDLSVDLSVVTREVIEETPSHTVYYELWFSGFDTVHQAYLLYVEPTAACQDPYHVTAEMHVPWAENHEHYHYFTHLKRSPMKLRLFKSNPNLTSTMEQRLFVTVTLLLDPKCTYKISITSSWYHRLAALTRNYSPTLLPFVAAIVLLAMRSNLENLNNEGACVSIHSALMSDCVKPYYAVVFGRLGTVAMTTFPALVIFLVNANWKNLELMLFTKSLLVLPAYMTALGILNVLAAVVLAIMLFSSQFASKLLLRILWRGGNGFPESVAAGLQKVPIVVSAALVCVVPLSCGAASMAAGATFYAFMISKMYEEYLEDYFYKLVAKIGSRICRIFKSKKDTDKSESKSTPSLQENAPAASVSGIQKTTDKKSKKKSPKESSNTITKDGSSESDETDDTKTLVQNEQGDEYEMDDDLSNLNFHMSMFFLWLTVTLVNIPALLTWARNFKYSMVLKPDTSYMAGLTLSICSTVIWQRKGPRRNLRYYDSLGSLLFVLAIIIVIIGPFTLAVINYVVSFVFAIITIQQLFDKEDDENEDEDQSDDDQNENKTRRNSVTSASKDNDEDEINNKDKEQSENNDQPEGNCDVYNEGSIYNFFKNLKEKMTSNNDA